MYLSYFDIDSITEDTQSRGVKKLRGYRAEVARVIEEHDAGRPEYSLVYPAEQQLHDRIDAVRAQFKGLRHLVLVGIGGSNLGVEAVHQVLDDGKVSLYSLDTVSSQAIDSLVTTLKKVRNVKQLAVCVISKSGNTAETVVNAGVLLQALEQQFGADIYKQTIFIGDPETDFMKTGKRLKVECITMPSIIGGRYSVPTEVGLIPMALLGYDTDAFIAGLLDATNDEFESVVAENAVRVHQYLMKGFRHYNFFAFEPRLEYLGRWYRQLTAESLGKAETRGGKPMTKGMLPTISTAVELHSVGQLYLSGFAGVYTDFVTFDDDAVDYMVPKKGIAKTYGGHTVEEVATAIYGGVMAAYQEKQLPYRSTIFDENLAYSVGLFMAMRMLETMYVAELLDINAFNQPNVELYKEKTRGILGV